MSNTLEMHVRRMSCGNLPAKGEPAIVDDSDGNRYWVKRSRSLQSSWLELDVFNWVEGHGWDTIAPLKRRETLEAIDAAMSQAGL